MSKIIASNIDEEINGLKTRIQGAVANFNVRSFAIVLIDLSIIDHYCIDLSDNFDSH